MRQISAPEVAQTQRGTASAAEPSLPADSVGPAGRWTALRALCCGIFLLLILLVFLCIRHWNDGHFVYGLDDPYIHLALSEQIAHGHYGINPTEYSSPASSIVWPFLLAMFAGSALHPYVPLLLSVAAGLAAVYVLAGIVEAIAPANRSGSGWPLRLLLTMLLMFCGNLISLPFLGMEHELQVLLAIVCAAGLCEVWSGRPMPGWSMAAAALGPLVRYESFAITVAVVAVLVATRQLRRAAVVFCVAALPVAAFGLFLRHVGLKALPSSVLLKSRQAYAGHSIGSRVFEVARTWISSFRHPGQWPVAALTCVLAVMLVRERVRHRRVVLAAAVLVGALHLLFGAFGWFHRYEVYAAVFLSILWLRQIWRPEPLRANSVLMGLFLLASPYLVATLETPASSHEVYGQQFQMRRFVNEYYRKSIAVNDIGLVSYRRPPGVFILDLWGLAWYEAGVADRTPEWLAGNVAARGIGLAMLYPDWYSVPDSWTPLGELCLDHKPLFLGGQCVGFYGTTPAAAAEIRPELKQFAPTLPRGTSFTFAQ